VGPRVVAHPFLRPAFPVDIELPYRQLPSHSHSSPVLCWCRVLCGPLLKQCPAKVLDIWLAIYYAYIIGYKWRTWSVRPLPPVFYVAALLLLSLPYLTSITDICVLRALHRVRAQLPARRLQHIDYSVDHGSRRDYATSHWQPTSAARVLARVRRFCGTHLLRRPLTMGRPVPGLHRGPLAGAPRQPRPCGSTAGFADPGPLDPLTNPAVRQQHKGDK
jgi:hypothetical protein